MEKRIVITGIGIVSSIGIGVEKFGASMMSGEVGIRAIKTFDTSRFSCHQGGEITGFDAASILGEKGTKRLDRTTGLVCSAAKLAAADAGIDFTESLKSETGVVIGTALGSVHSFSAFDRVAISSGFTAINPSDYPNTVPSTPASHISIMLGVDAFNITLSTGSASSLQAVAQGADFIRMKRADVVLAGGVESLCLENYLGFYRGGFLSGSRRGEPETCAPFDRNRNGIILGEGSSVIVLEDYERARRRGARIYAALLGFGTAFDPEAVVNRHSMTAIQIKSMRSALEHARLEPRSIDLLYASANSSVIGDALEALAIRTVFKENLGSLAITALKSMTAECFSASGSIQVGASALAIESGIIPPTANYREKDPDCDLPIVAHSRKARIDKTMVNSMGCEGMCCSMILGKLD